MCLLCSQRPVSPFSRLGVLSFGTKYLLPSSTFIHVSLSMLPLDRVDNICVLSADKSQEKGRKRDCKVMDLQGLAGRKDTCQERADTSSMEKSHVCPIGSTAGCCSTPMTNSFMVVCACFPLTP